MIYFAVCIKCRLVTWRWQAKRGREPGDLAKIAIGYLITALANLMMMIPAARADHGATVSVLWPISSLRTQARFSAYSRVSRMERSVPCRSWMRPRLMYAGMKSAFKAMARSRAWRAGSSCSASARATAWLNSTAYSSG